MLATMGAAPTIQKTAEAEADPPARDRPGRPRALDHAEGQADDRAAAPLPLPTPPDDLPPGRPPARAWRMFKAYWVTWVVIGSYLSARFQSRFRSEAAVSAMLHDRHLKNARRIERTIRTLQGLFIKVGQLISIMTNFLPEEFRAELEGLQDHVPPRPYADIQARIREEFDGRSPDELFAAFAELPIASASIGQVHTARLHSGETVAVKVQYPDIDKIVASDLKILRRIFRIVQWFLPYDGLNEVYREIKAMIVEELDFQREAQNINQIAENFDGRTDIAFPKVVPDLSTSRVLTTHFDGVTKISDVRSIERAGFDRQHLARLVVEHYCKQIFTDGFYHADPHPGNLMVREHPERAGELQVVFLDFGAVARVSPQMQHGIVELLQGAMSRDTQRIVRAMREMGFVARGADKQTFEKVVEYFHHQFQEQISLDSLSLKDVKFDPEKSLENLADLRRMDITLRELTSSFHVPREWILLERTLLLLMGLCTTLDPTMNPMTVIRPYLERFVLGEEGDWSTFVVDTTKDLGMAVLALPIEMRRFMTSARSGDLQVRFSNLERSTQIVYRMGQQVMLVSVGIASAALAVVFEGRGELARADIAWWVVKGTAALTALSWYSTRQKLKRRRWRDRGR
jgi:ubiquinone biosynthesis protein